VVDVAGAVEVVAAQRVELLQPVEQLEHQQVVQQHRPERLQQMRVVDVADVVVAAVLPFPRFVDRRLSHGFRSSRGQPRSTTTTRRTP
jgi:hypothetical protein